jgi:hypothetical protein
MSTLRALKKLLFGETWLLPAGIALVVAACALLIRPLNADLWQHDGGFILLAGVVAVLVAAVSRTARS